MTQFAKDTIPNQTSTTEAIQAWLAAQIAEQLDVEPDEIDVNLTFDNYSMDSVKAMTIVNRAEQFIGFPLPPALFWHYPTIAALSKRLAEDTTATEAELLFQVDEATLSQLLADLENP